jgi:hypothetical protein
MGISFMNTYGATSSTAQTVDIISKLVCSGLTGQIGSMIRTGKEGDYSSGGARDAYMSFSTALDDSLYERIRITSTGNVGIGTTSPLSALHQVGGGSYYTADARFGGSTTGFGVEIKYDQGAATYGTIYCSPGYANNGILLKLGAGSGNTDQLVLTGRGNVLVGTSTDPVAGVIVGVQAANNWTIYGKNTVASGTPYVFLAEFTGQAPNNSTGYFYYAGDTGAARFQVRSNGGIYNYQANDVNLSDVRTKKDIIPCESYWNKFKQIEIVKFKYKDQTHDDYNIGVIAQQVEEVAPELIDEEDWAKPGEESKIMKAVYTADLNHATIKVLQEAMAKIETLEARVQYLENK